MVLLSQGEANGIATIPDLLHSLLVPDRVWNAFTNVAGDAGNDVRLVAAMPPWTIPQIVGAAVLDEREADSNSSGSSGAGLAQCSMGNTP